MQECEYPGANTARLQSNKRIVGLAASANEYDKSIDIDVHDDFHLVFRKNIALISHDLLQSG